MTMLRKDMTFLMAALVVGLGVLGGCGKDKCKKSDKKTMAAGQEAGDTVKLADASGVLGDEQLDTSFFDDKTPDEFASADYESENFDVATLDDSDVTIEEKGGVAPFNTLHFAFNKSDVAEEEKAALTENVLAAREAIDKGHEVIIQGHCDQLGSPAYNLALSVERAQTIKGEMVKQGLPEDAIKVVGVGQEMPLVWSDAQDKQQLIDELAPNRRAEISIS